MATTQEIESRVIKQARKGSDVNPGLPGILPEILLAQAKHETGNFTSRAFRLHNNLFGYSYVPGARYQTGPGLIADNGQPVASYATIEDSVKEIIDWLYRRVKEGKFTFPEIQDPAAYAEKIRKAGYYTDTLENYRRGLLAFFRRPENFSFFGLVLLLSLVWFLRKP